MFPYLNKIWRANSYSQLKYSVLCFHSKSNKFLQLFIWPLYYFFCCKMQFQPWNISNKIAGSFRLFDFFDSYRKSVFLVFAKDSTIRWWPINGFISIAFILKVILKAMVHLVMYRLAKIWVWLGFQPSNFSGLSQVG